MKRTAAFILVLCSLLALCACGSGSHAKEIAKKVYSDILPGQKVSVAQSLYDDNINYITTGPYYTYGAYYMVEANGSDYYFDCFGTKFNMAYFYLDGSTDRVTEVALQDYDRDPYPYKTGAEAQKEFDKLVRNLNKTCEFLKEESEEFDDSYEKGMNIQREYNALINDKEYRLYAIIHRIDENYKNVFDSYVMIDIESK